MTRLQIIQHNVLRWTKERAHELTNTYREFDPDIILINSHGKPETERIKIYTYNTYTSNKSGEANDGVAIAVKNNIKHKVIDDFQAEVLAIELDTSLGPIIIATAYFPPRRPYLPDANFLRLLR